MKKITKIILAILAFFALITPLSLSLTSCSPEIGDGIIE